MNCSVVGICSSPFKGGNAETFPGNLLDEAKKRGAPAEAFRLSHFEVRDCSLKDYAHDILPGTEHDEPGLQSTAAMMERELELAGLIRRGS